MNAAEKRAPKVYATRPPCKWHEYHCHRPVPEAGTLCAYHQPMARASKRQQWDPGYDGYAPDPGCDCENCLRDAR